MIKRVLLILSITLLGYSDNIQFKFDTSKKCQKEYLKMWNDEKESRLYDVRKCKKGTFEYNALKITNKRVIKKLYKKIKLPK